MNDARTQMLERMYEDESLVGDLAGDRATQLRQWAIAQAEQYLQRTDLDDTAAMNAVRAIRTATRVAAGNGGDTSAAQAHLDKLLDKPNTTMAIRTSPLPEPEHDDSPEPPEPWWRRLFSFWRKG